MNELKKIIQILLLLTVLFFINLPLTNAEGISEEINEINLYIFGKGGHRSPTMESNPPGNISTMAPNTATDECQILHVENNSSDIIYWISDPLKADISIEGDVHFTIWAQCNPARYLGFFLFLDKTEPRGGGLGEGAYTGSKLVNDEPIEFNALLSEENFDSELKKFYIGERIGIGIEADYNRRQPPAEVKILYNSTNRPSHMTINTNSMSINLLNPKASNEKASIDVVITDAFGIYDIADYDVQITGPSGNNITNLEINEDRTMEKGNLILNITWKKTKEGGGNHTVTTHL